MYSRHHTHQKAHRFETRMDPDCAICRAPASVACDCEAKGLDQAVRQAEARMMQSIYTDIKNWVRGHAQDYILEYFRLICDKRRAAHEAHVERIRHHAHYYYQAEPHPSELAAANAQLKRGIDEDWQASVQRYPEVLEYFYSLVSLQLPDENEPAVKDPPLSALSGPRKVHPGPGPRMRGIAPAPSTGGRSIHGRGSVPPEMMRRTPPPPHHPPIEQRRTPAPRDRRRASFHQGPHPPAAYYLPQYQ